MVNSFNDSLINDNENSTFLSGFLTGFLLGVVSETSSFRSETANEAISKMFSTLNYFSTIPCPDDQNCLLPHCLFSHPTSQASTPIPDDARLSSPAPAANKRRKVSDEGSLTSLERPVSPPPLRSHGTPKKVTPKFSSPPRKLETKPVVSTPESVVAEPMVSKPAVSKPVTSKVSRTTLDIKKEPLYPRKLTREPASFPLRIMLIEALHTQYRRLNDEHLKSQNGPGKVPLHSEQELISMALDDEEKAAIEKPLVYSNVVKNRISVLKKMSLADWRKELLTKMVKMEKDAEVATNGKAAEPPPIVTGLTLREEQALLPRLVASLDNLQEYGYVLSPPSEKGIAEAKRGIEASQGWEQCDRCKTRFQVFPGRREEDGALTSGGTCTYHYGRALQPERKKDDAIKGHVLKKWTCCDQPIGSTLGCTTAPSHVFNVKEVKRLASVLQFEQTPHNPDVPDEAAICMDCEMCYTVHGLELVRLTATAWPSGEEVIDVLVRPVGELIDLNSRFSGVRPEHLAVAKPFDPSGGASLPPIEEGGALPIVPSPAAARELLFRYLNPDTPLIGHALENDLNASRVIHPTLVDTALLFPHRLGLPYRNSLKILMKNILKRSIQMGDGSMEGHDSKEDARAAGDLVRWKVGRDWEKLKKEGWKIKGGTLIPPEGADAAGKGKKRMGSVSLHEEGARKVRV